MQLVIDLPTREEQIAFNRKRWEEICADPDLAFLPGKVETNAFGQLLFMPLASGKHSHRTRSILKELERILGGIALPECPVSTIDGVRAVDIGWYSEERFAQVEGQIAFEIAPEICVEICVEILSPSNTAAEMANKRRLYFEAGAIEFWLCTEEGVMRFYTMGAGNEAQNCSHLCPAFPHNI